MKVCACPVMFILVVTSSEIWKMNDSLIQTLKNVMQHVPNEKLAHMSPPNDKMGIPDVSMLKQTRLTVRPYDTLHSQDFENSIHIELKILQILY